MCPGVPTKASSTQVLLWVHVTAASALDANVVVPKKVAAAKKTAAMKQWVDKGKKKVAAVVEISGRRK
jgi:hypothetical protein